MLAEPHANLGSITSDEGKQRCLICPEHREWINFRGTMRRRKEGGERHAAEQ